MKHQCDYCCWWTDYQGCEAPSGLRKKACEIAINRKHKDNENK